MLPFSSKPSRNKNDNDPTNGKATPIQGIMRIFSILNSNDSDHVSLLFSQPLDRRYQIWFCSTDQYCAIVNLHTEGLSSHDVFWSFPATFLYQLRIGAGNSWNLSTPFYVHVQLTISFLLNRQIHSICGCYRHHLCCLHYLCSYHHLSRPLSHDAVFIPSAPVWLLFLLLNQTPSERRLVTLTPSP